MSPDLGEMWRHGCQKSQDLDGDAELDSVEVEEEEDGESVTDRLRHLIESPLYITRLYGPFAELFFLQKKEDDKRKPAPPPD